MLPHAGRTSPPIPQSHCMIGWSQAEGLPLEFLSHAWRKLTKEENFDNLLQSLSACYLSISGWELDYSSWTYSRHCYDRAVGSSLILKQRSAVPMTLLLQKFRCFYINRKQSLVIAERTGVTISSPVDQ